MWLVFLILGVAAASTLIGVALVLFWAVPKVENRFVFRPTGEILRTPADYGIPFQQCFFETADGCRLSAWHFFPLNPRASVIYFHGNSGNLGLFTEVFQLLYRHGIQVFAVDYRGYGWSTGSPSETGVYRDALETIGYFKERMKTSGRPPLIYWGRSLGGCVAAFAASKSPPDGLILETAFPSKKSLLKNYPRLRLFQLFSRSRLDTAKHLKGHRFPVLLLHGDQDRTVPLEQGQSLFRKLTGPKQFRQIRGADHINIHRLDSAAYMRYVLEFAKEIGPRRVN
ncbi:MAG: alpha/beta hydrolase [Acidobacteriota bacterium]